MWMLTNWSQDGRGDYPSQTPVVCHQFVFAATLFPAGWLGPLPSGQEAHEMASS